ncbi:MAG: lactate utilization protein [Dysgonamonadaceae bacterium]|jgi:L-lactate dehydrogenase complex protein LldG|nr:lactate utilization protein [Dysgonamonadaceae bacterium]
MHKALILNSIRENKPDKFQVSDFVETRRTTFKPSISNFKSILLSSGGEFVECKKDEVDKIIKEKFPDALDFTREEFLQKYSASTKLSELDKVECALFDANFGVAENAAVWLEDKDLPHRILPFITQRLVLKLDAEKIVPTMHEAYQKIHLSETGYGVFISGPSKTADIEQSLVYGAHGAVKLTVILFTQN